MKYCLLTLVFAASLYGNGQRICSQVLIGNYATACMEGSELVKNHPEDRSLWEAYILALSKAGNEQEMLKAWKRYIERFPDQKNNRKVLENMAWGVIEKGVHSDSPLVRLYTTLGGYFAQDSRGVEILYRGMEDDNDAIRGLAIKLSSEMRDKKLKDRVFDLLRHEKNWKVRIEAILAAGKMEIKEAESYLIELLKQSSHEEKAAAFQALVYLLETPKREEVLQFATSDRADLRILACKVIRHAMMEDQIDLLLPLIQDHHPEVREEALLALGVLRYNQVSSVIPLLRDSNPRVAIMAAWLVTLKDPELGQKTFRTLIQSHKEQVRQLAAAALAGTGKYGYPLVLEVFQSTKDPYVKLNLALGMIGQRVETEKALEALYEGFATLPENWAWDEKSPFRRLTPSSVSYRQVNPEAVNLSVRLEILNILAIMNQKGLEEEVKAFLKKKPWGITANASALLLSEGDESAIEMVKKLLEEKDQKVRVQAALILSIWGGGAGTVSVLLEAYQMADRELKEIILESIGNIGSEEVIPFLIDRLGEPYPTLRIIAASSLIKTLYH